MRVPESSLFAAAIAAVALGVSPAIAFDDEPVPPLPTDVQPVTPVFADALDFERFVATVEKHHPLMDAARAGLDSLKARMNQADWGYFPSLRVTAAATVVPTITGDALDSDTDWSRPGFYGDARLEIIQPIFTSGRIEALQRAADSGVRVGRAAVEVARWELRMRAAEAWYSTILSREFDRLLSDGKTWIDKAEARMERQRDEDSPDYDQLEHLRLKTRIADFFEIQTRNALLGATARAGVRVLLQRPETEDPVLVEEALEPIALTLLDTSAYIAIARANDPGLQLADARARAQHALADSRSADLWPNVFIAGNVRATHANTVEKQRSIFAEDQFNRTLGAVALGLEWRLDIPQRIFMADEARASARRTLAEAAVQANLMEVNVTRLVQDLKNQQALLDVYLGSRRASQGWLTATWDTYEGGFGNFRDVMDALVQFYEKRLGYLQVVYNHNLAVFRLSQALGVDIRDLKSEAPPAPAGE